MQPMNIVCLQFNPIQENTYVVWDDTAECAVIDAGNASERENAALERFIAEHGLKPVLAVNTHGHFDHALGVEFVRRRYGVPFAMSSKDSFLLENAAVSGSLFGVKIGPMPSAPDIDLERTPEVRFGRTALRVIPTPGHTPGHVSLYEPESKTLFTGGRRLFVDHAVDSGEAPPAGRRGAGVPGPRARNDARTRDALQPLRRRGAQRRGELPQ